MYVCIIVLKIVIPLQLGSLDDKFEQPASVLLPEPARIRIAAADACPGLPGQSPRDNWEWSCIQQFEPYHKLQTNNFGARVLLLICCIPSCLYW